jgi:hypothetical protein
MQFPHCNYSLKKILRFCTSCTKAGGRARRLRSVRRCVRPMFWFCSPESRGPTDLALSRILFLPPLARCLFLQHGIGMARTGYSGAAKRSTWPIRSVG